MTNVARMMFLPFYRLFPGEDGKAGPSVSRPGDGFTGQLSGATGKAWGLPSWGVLQKDSHWCFYILGRDGVLLGSWWGLTKFGILFSVLPIWARVSTHTQALRGCGVAQLPQPWLSLAFSRSDTSWDHPQFRFIVAQSLFFLVGLV